MGAFDVVVLPVAEAQAREAFRWYFERSPLAADAFRTELPDAIDGLATNAAMWPEDHDGFRRDILHHFPFTVFWEIVDLRMSGAACAGRTRKAQNEMRS